MRLLFSHLMAFDAEHTTYERASKMGTEALGATISALELWSRTLNNWMLICAAGVAIFLVAEATLLISHWLNQNRLSLLRAQQASFYTEELVKLRETADQEKQRAAKAELRAAKAESALGARTLNTAQQLRIAAQLRQFSGTPFDCVVIPNPEPIGFLEQISSALEAAGWIRVAREDESTPAPAMHGKPKIGTMNNGFSGLAIEVSDDKISEWGQAGNGLGAALAAEGITAIRLNKINKGLATSNAVHIVVGVKP